MKVPKFFKKKKKGVVIVYKQGDTVPKNVTKVIFDSSVIEIPKNAFQDCTNLREVILNEGLHTIWYYAFARCVSLTIIKLPSTLTGVGVGAFHNCTNLREVVFNEGLQLIGAAAFRGCSSLTIIKLTSTVTEVYSGAFYECTNLREVVLNEGLQKIEFSAFAYCSSLAIIKFPAVSKRINNLIGAGQTEIRDKITIYQHFEWRGDEFLVSPEAIDNENWGTTRKNLDQLLAWISLKEATTIMEEVEIIYKQGDTVPKNVTKVIFDSSVIEVPEDAFQACTNLREVVLNEGLWRIGDWSFSGHKSLTIIELPSTVTEVGEYAFHDCTNLREVVLNKGLLKIEDWSFYGCTSLTIIKLPSSVTEVGDGAFNGCINLREVVLKEGLQKIGGGMFSNCTSLTNIKLPWTVTEIGAYAFEDCTNLREVLLNEGLQKIGKCAFDDCTALIIIKVPSTVTEVGVGAFDYCINLKEVVLNEGLQEIGYEAFARCTSLEFVKFPTISKRINNLIGAGQTEIEDKITIYHHFEWMGDEFLVSPEAINDEHWGTTRKNLDQLLVWMSYYELKEATTIIELAMWKTKIEETGAVTAEECSACRGEVPGPAKDAIIQYYG